MTAYIPKIKKDQIDVVILTLHERIIGQIHAIPSARTLDTLNKRRDEFISVTNAEVYQKIDNKLVFRTKFLSQNISHIVLVSEETEQF